MQNLLKAHPQTGAIVLQFGGLIPGVAQAVKDAGKTGEIKVYSIGGTQQDKPAIIGRPGDVHRPVLPVHAAYCAVEMLGALQRRA